MASQLSKLCENKIKPFVFLEVFYAGVQTGNYTRFMFVTQRADGASGEREQASILRR